ncbi:MAG: aldehyde ferredoxin oxidoreductase family protein [Bacillota bacterium]
MEVLRINLSKNNIKQENPPKDWQNLGGRALISKIMVDEVNPTCNPLGEDNKLIIAPGILAGTTVSCVNRISIGSKSPLTGTIKESNAGGTTAFKLARLGIKTIIIEGKSDKPKILYISKDKIEIISAKEIWGMGVYGSAEKLKEKYNKKIGLVLIGPAGERQYRSAGIANNDNDGSPSRYSGRGGLGAVMGSKNIKAIIIDDGNTDEVPIHDEVKFKDSKKTITDMILGNDAIKNSYTMYGTSNLVKLTNSIGALPTMNFSKGSFEGSENINGQKIHDLIVERGGEGNTSHGCMPGCLIRCSNVFPDKDGKTIVSPIEYETIGLLGPNLAIGNIDTIAKLNYMCNDLGLDTIEMGGAIGVAMEAGVINFGDEAGALNILEEIRKDTYLGKIIASGASSTGKVLGITRVPTVKDQTMAAYDPRAIKGLGVTYATSTQGADHTAGQTIRANVDHRKPEGQVEASKGAQITNTLHDCLGTCFFLGGGIGGDLNLLGELYLSMSGVKLSLDELMKISKDTLKRERKFNTDAGFSSADDMLPEFFYKEENPDSGTVFDVDKNEMDKLFDF